MFKRGGALSTLCIFKLKGNIKYSRLILMDFKNKDLRENPYQEGVLVVEQTTSTNSPLHVMSSRHEAPLITHGNGALGEDRPRSVHT